MCSHLSLAPSALTLGSSLPWPCLPGWGGGRAGVLLGIDEPTEASQKMGSPRAPRFPPSLLHAAFPLLSDGC